MLIYSKIYLKSLFVSFLLSFLRVKPDMDPENVITFGKNLLFSLKGTNLCSQFKISYLLDQLLIASSLIILYDGI